MQLSELNNVDKANSLAAYFGQIYKLIRKLEYSLSISRHLENQEAIRIKLLQAENERLMNQIEQLTKKKENEEMDDVINTNNKRNNDLRIHEPCSTMSLVNLQYKLISLLIYLYSLQNTYFHFYIKIQTI